MGEVWVTRDVRLDREVALKRLCRPDDEGEARVKISDLKQVRFLREAQLTGSLEHPNIVSVYDLCVDESGDLTRAGASPLGPERAVTPRAVRSATARG